MQTRSLILPLSALRVTPVHSGQTRMPPPSGGVEYVKRLSGVSAGPPGDFITWHDRASTIQISATSPTLIMSTTGLKSGTYRFRYTIRYNTAGTTTGIGFTAQQTGGFPTYYNHNWWFISTGAAAATGVHDQVTTVTGGQMAEGKAEDTHGVISSKTAGVSDAAGIKFALMEGIIRIFGSDRTLEFLAASEIAGNICTIFTLQLELHALQLD